MKNMLRVIKTKKKENEGNTDSQDMRRERKY